MRLAIEISLESGPGARLQYLLSRADALGPIAPDRDAMATNVELFAEFCADLQRRNLDREHPVPWAAIERMLDSWEAPSITECHELVCWHADA